MGLTIEEKRQLVKRGWRYLMEIGYGKKQSIFFFDKKWHLAEEGSLVWGYVKDMEN